MKENPDIDYLLSNRDAFNDLIYTPVMEAVEELKKRWEDIELKDKISDYLNNDVPEPLINGYGAVFFRQIITPNYELRRFMSVPDVLDLKPVFWEYHNDKFTSNNSVKHSLGKIPTHKGVGKKGGAKIDYDNVIDFNKSNGRKMKEVETLWGQSLVDFHHELLESVVPNSKNYIFDASEWFAKKNGTAKNYYKSYIALFVRNAILFENFVLEKDELEFTRDIFLPAFFDIWKTTGKKPIIVALEPTEIEGEIFWMCHPPEVINNILTKKRII